MNTDDWAVSVPAGYRVGPWRITGPLGSGSWGGVYSAEPADGADVDGAPDQVAIKFVPTQMLTARRLRHLAEMADREMAALAALSHPRLIRRYSTHVVTDPDDRSLDGAVAVVMDRAARSLADAIAPGATPPAPPAGEVVAQICDGLAHMHGQGWIHGDLKPGNVLLMADGSVRLADFGLATELEGTHGYLPPAGSAEYTPPERWAESLSERGAAVRPSADVWALGVTAHQVLTGRSPFPGAGGRARMAAAAEFVTGRAELTLGADLPAPWRALIADCLHRDPAARPDAAQLRERTRALAEAEPVGPAASAGSRQGGPAGTAPQTEPRPGQAPRAPGRRRAVGVAVLLALAAGTAGAAVLAGELPGRGRDAAHPAWFPAGSEVPAKYQDLIVAAGGTCAAPGVNPATVAAVLSAESGFDPALHDEANNEFGIARWTPSVLRNYLPEGQRDVAPIPPFSPEVSIPAVGRYLCRLSTLLADVDGDPSLKIGVAFQSSSDAVMAQGLRPAAIADYVDRLTAALDRYTDPPALAAAAAPGACQPGAVCVTDGRGATTTLPRSTDRGPGLAARSVVNAGPTCVALFTGPRQTGERLDLTPGAGSADLRRTPFFQAIGSVAPC